MIWRFFTSFCSSICRVLSGNVSLEASAGYLNVDPNNGRSRDKAFAFGDVAFYPVENFRLALGASSVADFESGHATAEYLLDAMPVSLKLKGEVGENKFTAVTAGVSFYFGGDSPTKTLMRRHREDDPRNKVLDIFGAGAAAFSSRVNSAAPPPPPVCDPEFPDPEIFSTPPPGAFHC